MNKKLNVSRILLWGLASMDISLVAINLLEHAGIAKDMEPVSATFVAGVNVLILLAAGLFSKNSK